MEINRKKGLSIEKNWNKIYLKNRKQINKLFNQNFSKEIKKEKLNAIKELNTLATRKASEKTLIRLRQRKIH